MNAWIGFFISVAACQHHALADAKLHLRGRKVGQQQGVLATKFFRLVSAGKAREDIARLGLANI